MQAMFLELLEMYDPSWPRMRTYVMPNVVSASGWKLTGAGIPILLKNGKRYPRSFTFPPADSKQ